MRIMLWVGDEGPTDIDLRDGDIWGIRDDAWIPGTLETKRFLIIQTDEYQNDKTELSQPEYTTGADGPVQRHARKYQVRYWEKLTPEELVTARDKEADFPILSGRFDIWDIIRK